MNNQMDVSASGETESIGSCFMEEDGTLVLELLATGDGGMVGHGTLKYKPDHPNYKEIFDHVGPIKPGDTKPVAPFD